MAFFSNEIILNDNQASYADIMIFDIYSFKGVEINYMVKRADKTEMGNIFLTFDRVTLVSKLITISHFDVTGINFSSDIINNNVRLRYTSTSNGIKPVFKYDLTGFSL